MTIFQSKMSTYFIPTSENGELDYRLYRTGSQIIIYFNTNFDYETNILSHASTRTSVHTL